MFVQPRQRKFKFISKDLSLFIRGGRGYIASRVVCSFLGQVISSQVPRGGHRDNIDSNFGFSGYPRSI